VGDFYANSAATSAEQSGFAEGVDDARSSRFERNFQDRPKKAEN
jgi:hypothetical protein